MYVYPCHRHRHHRTIIGPVVGITGNALPEDMDFFVSSGADQVVTKPLSRAKLMDALHGLVPTAMAAMDDAQGGGGGGEA